MGKLQDKVAVVTGGGSGMGRAGSVRFAREGANTIDVAALVSNTIKLEDISSGFELMQNRSKGFIKAVIRMP